VTTGAGRARNRLFQSQQALDKIGIWRADQSFFVHETFAFLGLFGENVAFERFLEGDLAGAGHFKTLFGTGIRLYLWHFLIILNDTLLADPHRRNTYGAVWVMSMDPSIHFMERKGRLF
jgi:hypothetical protein